MRISSFYTHYHHQCKKHLDNEIFFLYNRKKGRPLVIIVMPAMNLEGERERKIYSLIKKKKKKEEKDTVRF
jgi:hypothetical protein